MKIVLLLLLMSITIGCKEIGTSEDGQFQIVEDIPIDQKVTFKDVFNNVISTNRCMQCHSSWASDEQKVLQRIKAGDPDGSRFFARMKDGSMPLGGPAVSTASLELVERYINDLVISEVEQETEDEDEEDDTPPVIVTPPDQKVTFNDVFNKVINTNRCMQCHSNWASDEQKVLQRIKAGDPEASSFFTRMENGSMPLGGPVVSDESLEIVKKYIEGLKEDQQEDQDEEEDTPPVIITPPDQKITFKDVFDKVISTNRCLQCHSSWASDEKQVLQRIKAGDPGASSFFIRMENGSMPLGGPVVSDESLEIVKRYIEGLVKQ